MGAFVRTAATANAAAAAATASQCQKSMSIESFCRHVVLRCIVTVDGLRIIVVHFHCASIRPSVQRHMTPSTLLSSLVRSARSHRTTRYRLVRSIVGRTPSDQSGRPVRSMAGQDGSSCSRRVADSWRPLDRMLTSSTAMKHVRASESRSAGYNVANVLPHSR